MESKTEEIRLLILGHTGAGKSSAGNYIIGKKVFDSYTGAESQTKRFNEHKCEVNGRNVVLADTPGFFDTKNADVEKEIKRNLSTFKPNVFLFVITLSNRFPHEAELTLDRIENMLRKDMYRCSVVLFTATDYLEGTPLSQFVRSQSAHLKVRELVKKCGGRFVGFNNHAKGSEREDQVQELMTQIDKIGELKEYIIPSKASKWSTDVIPSKASESSTDVIPSKASESSTYGTSSWLNSVSHFFNSRSILNCAADNGNEAPIDINADHQGNSGDEELVTLRKASLTSINHSIRAILDDMNAVIKDTKCTVSYNDNLGMTIWNAFLVIVCVAVLITYIYYIHIICNE